MKRLSSAMARLILATAIGFALLVESTMPKSSAMQRILLVQMRKRVGPRVALLARFVFPRFYIGYQGMVCMTKSSRRGCLVPPAYDDQNSTDIRPSASSRWSFYHAQLDAHGRQPPPVPAPNDTDEMETLLRLRALHRAKHPLAGRAAPRLSRSYEII